MKRGLGNVMRTLGSLFLILVGSWVALAWGMTLWDDWNIFGEKLTPYNAVSTVTTCSNDMLGIGNCIVTNNGERTNIEPLDNGIKYLIYGVNADSKFTLMYARNSKIYTTDLGMNHLLNRSIILLVLSGLPIFLGFFGLLIEAFGG
jgi:hypothetical protein